MPPHPASLVLENRSLSMWKLGSYRQMHFLANHRKYGRFQTDGAFRAALATGDSDGDGIPNSLDRCPGTGDLTPTDGQGCRVAVQPCSSPLGICTTGYDIDRALGDLKIMFNKSCAGAPQPTTPSPLDWGRGRQLILPSIYGYNLLVSRVVNQPQDCEVFYEVEFRLTALWFDQDPWATGPLGAPEPLYVTAMFSERESLTHDPRTVMLPLRFSWRPRIRARAPDWRTGWATISAYRGAFAR